MEDFPTQSISLSYTDGSQSIRTSNNTLCKLPVQFAVIVDPPVTSCMEGLYLPMFLSPTPAQGALLYASADQPLEITVRAQATQSTVSELLVSGPSSITENTTVPGEYLLRWTPTEDEEGGYYPVCFIAQGVNDSFMYHSELRCLIVRVGNTSGYVVVLRIKLSSLIALTDDYIRNVVLQQLREELIRQGLPGDFALRLRATHGISS
ncbi:uncharacterized protein [Oncorhynchus clarkii lewisi]|uniref:uncharacterized protein n=1 Tax=Oncorhynchus clarkii lewisi TaxID=490388 RepID=UPI0039B8C223